MVWLEIQIAKVIAAEQIGGRIFGICLLVLAIVGIKREVAQSSW